MAIRLVLLAQHYRHDWEYTPDLLEAAQARLHRWREALSVNLGAESESTIASVRAALADDLDTPAALVAVDAWAERTLHGEWTTRSAPGPLARILDALLGIRI